MARHGPQCSPALSASGCSDEGGTVTPGGGAKSAGRASQRCARTIARSAATGRGKTAMIASPIVSTMPPSSAATAALKDLNNA